MWTSPAVRFQTTFSLVLVPFFWAYQIGYTSLDPFQGLTVWLVTHASNFVGLSASSVGSVVSFGGGSFSYDVEQGCTGSAVALVMSAAVLAYPSPWRVRLLGVLAVLPLVLVINLVRLVTMG